MNAKDVKCPICGTVNRSLDLDETDGWMECEIPYDNDSFAVEADNLLNFIKFRRSVRRFKDKEVEQEKIEGEWRCWRIGRFTLGIAQTVRRR